MSFAEFQATLAHSAPPSLLSRSLLALWHDGRGEWDRAHGEAQQAAGREGAWVHAYLHRKTGDVENAGYWYARAAQPQPAAEVPSAVEWAEIVRRLLT